MTRSDMATVGTVVALVLLLGSIPFWPGVGLPMSQAGSAPRPTRKLTTSERQREYEQLVRELDADMAALDAMIDQAAGKACQGAVTLHDQTLSGDDSVQGLIRVEVDQGVLRGKFPDAPGRGRFVGGRGDFVVVDWTDRGCQVVDQGTLTP